MTLKLRRGWLLWVVFVAFGVVGSHSTPLEAEDSEYLDQRFSGTKTPADCEKEPRFGSTGGGGSNTDILLGVPFRGMCYVYWASKQPDMAICEHIKRNALGTWDECVKVVAIKKSDYELCSEIADCAGCGHPANNRWSCVWDVAGEEQQAAGKVSQFAADAKGNLERAVARCDETFRIPWNIDNCYAWASDAYFTSSVQDERPAHPSVKECVESPHVGVWKACMYGWKTFKALTSEPSLLKSVEEIVKRDPERKALFCGVLEDHFGRKSHSNRSEGAKTLYAAVCR